MTRLVYVLGSVTNARDLCLRKLSTTGTYPAPGDFSYFEFPESEYRSPEQQLLHADHLIHISKHEDRPRVVRTYSEAIALRWLRRVRETHEEENPSGLDLRADELLFLINGEGYGYWPRVTEDGGFTDVWANTRGVGGGLFEWRRKELF